MYIDKKYSIFVYNTILQIVNRAYDEMQEIIDKFGFITDEIYSEPGYITFLIYPNKESDYDFSIYQIELFKIWLNYKIIEEGSKYLNNME